MIFLSTYLDFPPPAPLYSAHTWLTHLPLKTRRKSCKMCRHCWIWNIRTGTSAADWLNDGWRHFLLKLTMRDTCHSLVYVKSSVIKKTSCPVLCCVNVMCSMMRLSFLLWLKMHYHKEDSSASLLKLAHDLTKFRLLFMVMNLENSNFWKVNFNNFRTTR